MQPLRRSRLVVTLALATIALGWGAVAEAQAQAVGSVQTVAGSVTLVRGGAPRPLTQGGVALQIGDTVQTGPTGRARIVTHDGRRVTLGPNSSVTLGRGGRPGAWQLQAGRAAVWATGRGRLEVATPSAIAAAEGTGFELLVAADGTSTLTVAEGTVEYYNDHGRVAVAANQQSVARPGEAPSRPIAVDASGVVLFEGTIENLPLPIEPPRFFTPSPNTANAFGTVIQALSQRRPDEAAPAVQLLSQGSPNAPETALASGLFLLAQGRAEEALPLLTRATEQAPQSPVGPTYVGVAHLRQARLEAAEASLREAIRRQPQAHAAHAYLSSVLLARGETAGAEASARRAVELAPDSGLAREALGTVYLFSGRPREAIVELRRALAINPLSPSGRLQLAKALAAADDLEAAMTEASYAVALDPGDPSARVTLGILFLANKDAVRAEREFRYAMRLAPNLASARTGLGAVAAQRGQFARALREQRAAVELDAGSVQVRNNLGVALTARGDLHRAVDELEEAVRLQPDYAVAHANLAVAYLELNEYALAVKAAERAVALGDRSAFVHTTLARVYMRQRRYDRALAELRRAEEVDPEYPLQHFYLSEIYRLQGRDRDALRAIFRGVTLDPAAMVEQRLFARTEATGLGGSEGNWLRLFKTDGRSDSGKMSYFLTHVGERDDGPFRNDDLRTEFTETIFGYQPSPRLNVVLFSSFLRDEGGRPGRITASGPETPRFRSDLNGTDLQVMGRYLVRRGSYFTLKSGFRALSVLGEDPLDTFTFRNFRSREENFYLEGRWDHQIDERDGLVTGLSYVRNERLFDGRFVLVPGPGFGTTRHREDPGLIVGYVEWHRQLDDRTRILLGPYVGTQSGAGGILLPKFVARRRMGDGATLALLSYPIFQERNADLRPVETWARPFDIERLGLDDGGWLMNHELTWQQPGPEGSLFALTGFYRRAHRLLLPIVDPDKSGLPSRAFFPRAELMGVEASYERWLNDRITGRVFARHQSTNALLGGIELPYFPRWEAGVRFDYVDTNGVRSALTLHYVGRRNHIDFVGGPSTRLGGFITLDFRVELQLNLRNNLFLEVRDLFDRGPAFYSGYPSNGRTLLGGVDRRF